MSYILHMKENKLPLYIYYHVACIDIDYQDIINEQIGLLIKTGLYDAADKIFYSHVGGNNVTLPPKFERIYRNKNFTVAELPIMDVILSHSKIRDFNCLYFHTKGSGRNFSKLPKQVGNDWRHYMQHFNIEFWEQNLKLLEEYDTVGTSFLQGKGWYGSHYSGNFWWSKSDYIKTLSPVNEIKMVSYANPRYKAEMWILSNPNAKHYNWYDYDPNSSALEFVSSDKYLKTNG